MELEGKIVARFAKLLASYEVTDIPKHWKPRIGRQKIFQTRCFDMGGKYFQKHCFPDDVMNHCPNKNFIEGILLVHGVYDAVPGQPELMCYECHCWVELPGGVVYDGSINRFYRNQDYLRITGAIPFVKYLPMEYVKESVKYHDWELGFGEKFHHGGALNRDQLEKVLRKIESQVGSGER